MTRDDSVEVVFGGFDGLCSALGVIVAVASQGNLRAVAVGSVALAVGSAASMGAGQWLSDRQGNLRKACLMAGATLAGSILPAIPFFALTGPLAWLCCGAVTLGLGAVIAEVRPGGALRSYTLTFTVLS